MTAAERLRALIDCPTTTEPEREAARAFLARVDAREAAAAAALRARQDRIALAYWQGQAPEPEIDIRL